MAFDERLGLAQENMGNQPVGPVLTERAVFELWQFRVDDVNAFDCWNRSDLVFPKESLLFG